MKKELQFQLDSLLAILGGDTEHPEYKKLEAMLSEANKVPKSEWNDPELHERMKEATQVVQQNTDS